MLWIFAPNARFIKDTAEVAAVVRACAQAGVAMVPQGGNTSLCGAATPAPKARRW
jgi:FAD/FMN-containing dehydrogenase